MSGVRPGLRLVYRAVVGRLPPWAELRVRRVLLRTRRTIRAVAAGGGLRDGATLMTVPPRRRHGGPVAVVLWGLDEAALAAAADRLAALRARDPGFAPLVVTDSDAFGVLRGHDLVFEYLPSKADWEARVGAGYAEFAEARLAAIADAYRPRRFVYGADAVG